MRPQCISIGKELVAEIYEPILEVAAVESVGWRTIIDQSTYILRKAAAKVKQRGLRPRRCKAGKDTRVAGMNGNGGCKEFELTNARIGKGLPCFFSLDMLAPL